MDVANEQYQSTTSGTSPVNGSSFFSQMIINHVTKAASPFIQDNKTIIQEESCRSVPSDFLSKRI